MNETYGTWGIGNDSTRDPCPMAFKITPLTLRNDTAYRRCDLDFLFKIQYSILSGMLDLFAVFLLSFNLNSHSLLTHPKIVKYQVVSTILFAIYFFLSMISLSNFYFHLVKAKNKVRVDNKPLILSFVSTIITGLCIGEVSNINAAHHDDGCNSLMMSDLTTALAYISGDILLQGVKKGVSLKEPLKLQGGGRGGVASMAVTTAEDAALKRSPLGSKFFSTARVIKYVITLINGVLPRKIWCQFYVEDMTIRPILRAIILGVFCLAFFDLFQESFRYNGRVSVRIMKQRDLEKSKPKPKAVPDSPGKGQGSPGRPSRTTEVQESSVPIDVLVAVRKRLIVLMVITATISAGLAYLSGTVATTIGTTMSVSKALSSITPYTDLLQVCRVIGLAYLIYITMSFGQEQILEDAHDESQGKDEGGNMVKTNFNNTDSDSIFMRLLSTWIECITKWRATTTSAVYSVYINVICGVVFYFSVALALIWNDNYIGILTYSIFMATAVFALCCLWNTKWDRSDELLSCINSIKGKRPRWYNYGSVFYEIMSLIVLALNKDLLRWSVTWTEVDSKIDLLSEIFYPELRNWRKFFPGFTPSVADDIYITTLWFIVVLATARSLAPYVYFPQRVSRVVNVCSLFMHDLFLMPVVSYLLKGSKCFRSQSTTGECDPTYENILGLWGVLGITNFLLFGVGSYYISMVRNRASLPRVWDIPGFASAKLALKHCIVTASVGFPPSWIVGRAVVNVLCLFVLTALTYCMAPNLGPHQRKFLMIRTIGYTMATGINSASLVALLLENSLAPQPWATVSLCMYVFLTVIPAAAMYFAIASDFKVRARITTEVCKVVKEETDYEKLLEDYTRRMGNDKSNKSLRRRSISLANSFTSQFGPVLALHVHTSLQENLYRNLNFSRSGDAKSVDKSLQFLLAACTFYDGVRKTNSLYSNGLKLIWKQCSLHFAEVEAAFELEGQNGNSKVLLEQFVSLVNHLSALTIKIGSIRRYLYFMSRDGLFIQVLTLHNRLILFIDKEFEANRIMDPTTGDLLKGVLQGMLDLIRLYRKYDLISSLNTRKHKEDVAIKRDSELDLKNNTVVGGRMSHHSRGSSGEGMSRSRASAVGGESEKHYVVYMRILCNDPSLKHVANRIAGGSALTKVSASKAVESHMSKKREKGDLIASPLTQGASKVLKSAGSFFKSSSDALKKTSSFMKTGSDSLKRLGMKVTPDEAPSPDSPRNRSDSPMTNSLTSPKSGIDAERAKTPSSEMLRRSNKEGSDSVDSFLDSDKGKMLSRPSAITKQTKQSTGKKMMMNKFNSAEAVEQSINYWESRTLVILQTEGDFGKLDHVPSDAQLVLLLDIPNTVAELENILRVRIQSIIDDAILSKRCAVVFGAELIRNNRNIRQENIEEILKDLWESISAATRAKTGITLSRVKMEIVFFDSNYFEFKGMCKAAVSATDDGDALNNYLTTLEEHAINMLDADLESATMLASLGVTGIAATTKPAK